MSPRFGILSSVLLMASCGYQYPGLRVSPLKISFGSSNFKGGVDTSSRPVDSQDFVPAGGAMRVVDGNRGDYEFDLGVEVFQPLPLDFIIGLSGNYLMGSNFGADLFFSQALASHNFNWWDVVPYDEVDLYRTPSIGGYFGKLFWTQKGRGGLLIQYGISVSRYRLVRYEFFGVDVYGGQNYSTLKNTINLGSGTSVRQTIEIGFDEGIRLGFWSETDGMVKMGGVQLIISLPFPVLEPPPKCEGFLGAYKHMNDSYHDQQRYKEYCGDN